MDKMNAEQFLASVKLAAEAADFELENLEFKTPSGMRCSWYRNDDDYPDQEWQFGEASFGEAN